MLVYLHESIQQMWRKTMSTDTIHEVVRNRYGAIARSVDTDATASSCETSAQSTGCCGSATQGESGCGCDGGLYEASLIEGLPVDVTALSLGCGRTQFT
jgi:hypothetical protein